MREISGFEDEFFFLSNFFLSPVELTTDGLTYPTAEHAYQASKSLSHDERLIIRTARSPAEAKRMGRRVTLRPAWDSVKIGVMRDIVWQKFAQNPHLRERLLETGDAKLVESNMWGDRFWGVDHRGVGENHLGRILMEVRDRITKRKLSRNK